MSVGDVAQSVWSASRRSAAVDWDKQEEQLQQQTNQNQYTTNTRINTRMNSRVSRSLFGPTDPQENRRMAYEEIDNKRFTDRNRWNFDFYREKPISGRFEWKKVNDNNNFGETGEEADTFWSNKNSAKYCHSSTTTSFNGIFVNWLIFVMITIL
jgi:hypothetical protein